jgi:hypothetical protein
MSAWAVGAKVSAAMVSARLAASVFTDASPVSGHALGLNIEPGHAEQAYSEKLQQSTARFGRVALLIAKHQAGITRAVERDACLMLLAGASSR